MERVRALKTGEQGGKQMPFKIHKIKGGRFLVMEHIEGKPRPIMRANKSNRKEALDFIKECE